MIVIKIHYNDIVLRLIKDSSLYTYIYFKNFKIGFNWSKETIKRTAVLFNI